MWIENAEFRRKVQSGTDIITLLFDFQNVCYYYILVKLGYYYCTSKFFKHFRATALHLNPHDEKVYVHVSYFPWDDLEKKT